MVLPRKQQRALTAIENTLVDDRTLTAVADLFAVPPPVLGEPVRHRSIPRHVPRLRAVVVLQVVALAVTAAMIAFAAVDHLVVLEAFGIVGLICVLGVLLTRRVADHVSRRYRRTAPGTRR